MDQEKIGNFILNARKRKNLTQEELAEILGVNNRTISRWENGRNMPDVSLFKPLCKVLDISVEELINGEESNKSNRFNGYEKAIISTIDFNVKISKKMNSLVKIFLLIMVAILVISSSIVLYYKNKYPKIDIYNISTINSDENKLNEHLTLNRDGFRIWFYGIDSLQLGDSKNNYYDLRSALDYNQVTIEDVRNYLDVQYDNGNIERYILWDGGTKVYKSKKYEVILCNTIDGNKDIYFGISNIGDGLKGEYCGKEKSDTCYFTRTYHVISIEEDNDESLVNVTLREFQGDIAMVKVNKGNNIMAGNSYEFVFSTYEVFDDNINDIFENSALIEIKKTEKQGLEQVNEKICVNN